MGGTYILRLEHATFTRDSGLSTAERYFAVAVNLRTHELHYSYGSLGQMLHFVHIFTA